MTVMLTPAQARAVAALAERRGTLTLHQLAHDREGAAADDLYATPQGAAEGYRITNEGALSEIGETLPADAPTPQS
ncbi:MAG TPA: hypothetical protein VLW49_11245 [Gaiellaceae bacterium]|nr:hypothetical protein [Gaiellaceae bacterium]